MAGKSNKAKNKSKAANSSPVSPIEPESKPVESIEPTVETTVNNGDSNGAIENTGTETGTESNTNEVTADTKTDEPNQKKEAELNLFTVPVKVQSGEKLELQLSPGDSVIDIRQFLLDAPETCFFTCYDLVLHGKETSSQLLDDYNEIGDVADITSGCYLEMIPALYDERSIRSHVRRSRELLSLSNLHVSLSSSLAMNHELDKQKTSGKQEVQEQDGLGFLEDSQSCLPNLIISHKSDIKCIESIVFSSLNPPPSYRRFQGDLIYIDVTTLEGNSYCITGGTKSFFVNSSTGVSLDPKPAKNSHESSTLIGVLQKISPKFKKGFKEVLERKSTAHPFENVQALLPTNSWLAPFPVPEHKRDGARAEDAVVLTYGSETIGMQRDWNEEIQSCYDFPHNNPQEKILRGRAMYKVSCDFIDAAIKGAIGVINRSILPINPTDPECFHMYVHNNIFFSFALDSYFENLSKDKKNPDSPEKTNKNKPTNPNSLDLSDKNKTTNPNPNSALDLSDEANLADSEQATYDSANNDLRGTKAYQEADVPGLYNLAMAIIDYRGFRVVAQSIIPGILQGDKSESLLYGSVDNGKKICWNESFHAKVVEAGKKLHLKEHEVLDGSGNSVKLAAPVECKGIVGSDDRHYLLDLMRVTPRDANYMGPEHRFSVLRPELISSFIESETPAKKPEPKTTEEKPDDNNDSQNAPAAESSETSDDEKESYEKDNVVTGPEILFNPNVFTDFKLAGNPEEIEGDEALVKKAGSYLIDIVIPKFVKDLCALEISPMDGQTLTDALHAHGINIRYLGKIAGMIKHLPHLWDLFTNEIVVRSAKHAIKDVLRGSEDHDVGPAIAHVLNCVFGDVCPAIIKTGFEKSKSHKKGQENQANKSINKVQMRRGHGGHPLTKGFVNYTTLTSDSIWTSINEYAKFKYQFEIPEDVRKNIKRVAVLRNLSLKIGLVIAARKYDVEASAPFIASDILNLQPVVKHSVPVCTEARELMEAGKSRLAEGILNEAYILLTEAMSLLQQITGPMHKDVANCSRYIGMVLYHAGDIGGALVQQHRELIINERCLGLDHCDTAHSYANMGSFYHGLSQTDLALKHMLRALLLLSLTTGPDHPEISNMLMNIAAMYQESGKMNLSLRYLQEALKKSEKLLGEDHIQTAFCYHSLAIACNCMGAFKLSVQHEKKTYDILAKQLGEDDNRTKESETWIRTFKNREQQKLKGQAVSSDSAMKAMDILKAHPDLLQAFQAMSAPGNNNKTNPQNAAPNLSRSLNASAANQGRPRGIDERAARAAAEIRRKAAARGLSVRQPPTNQNAPPQSSTSPLTQLLNLINSGEAAEAAQAAEVKENGGDKDNNNKGPVGLGTSLETSKKKQKQKEKATNAAA